MSTYVSRQFFSQRKNEVHAFKQTGIHCLVDVDQCREGDLKCYEIRREMMIHTVERTEWTTSETPLCTHARSVGSRRHVFHEAGTIVKGLRVTVKGTVESSDDTIPLLMVTEILPDSSGCGGNLTIPSDDIVSCSSKVHQYDSCSRHS